MKKYIIFILVCMLENSNYCAQETNGPKNLDGLWEEIRKSDDTKAFICKVGRCPREFTSHGGWHHHFEDAHLGKRQKTADRSKGSKERANAYTRQRVNCKVCKKDLNYGAMRKHLRTMHNILPSYSCRYGGCEETFSKQVERNNHENKKHAKDVRSLFEGSLEEKARAAEDVGLYDYYDITSLPLITREENDLLDRGIRAIMQRYKARGMAYDFERFTDDLNEFFKKIYTEELHRSNPVKKAELLVQIYKDAKPDLVTGNRGSNSTLIVPEERRITIKKSQMRHINNVIGTYVTSNKGGASIDMGSYPDKKAVREAFYKGVGQYCQALFDDEIERAGLLKEEEELSAEERVIVDAAEEKYKQLKNDIRTLFNKLPLHVKERGYALKHAAYKVVADEQAEAAE